VFPPLSSKTKPATRTSDFSIYQLSGCPVKLLVLVFQSVKEHEILALEERNDRIMQSMLFQSPSLFQSVP